MAPNTGQLLHAAIYFFPLVYLLIHFTSDLSSPLSSQFPSYTAPYLSLLVLDADCLLGSCQLPAGGPEDFLTCQLNYIECFKKQSRCCLIFLE